MPYPRMASFKNHTQFTEYLAELGIDIPCDTNIETAPDSPLAKTIQLGDTVIGNRFCILPMEGWDGTTDGKPTELTQRRWQNFGLSGAKLIWGGEAVAVRHDGRANPNQLVMNVQNLKELESLRTLLVKTHESEFGDSSDLVVGLQLTHSGRFARPNRKDTIEPRTVQRNKVLDQRVGIVDDSAIFTDDEISKLIEDFVESAKLAEQIGFRFVDIKHCHGYFGHELLSGVDRPGKYGGSFENRTRFLKEITQGIRANCPDLQIGVRISAFDFLPYCPGEDGCGVPEPDANPKYAFGGDAAGRDLDLEEPSNFMTLLETLGIRLVCTTAGSPYYNPHIQRPAYFPPSDGYQPPEEPLVGVARQIAVTAELKKKHPDLVFVGSGYTYLQDWLPHVAQAVVRSGWVDSVGLGRMVLSYPDLPADVLRGNVMARKKICRTFSDCTTAPRNGIVSGCYPLDRFYIDRTDDWERLKQLKSNV